MIPMRPVFAAPSIEGVRLALPDLLGKRQPVACMGRCAVAIDVFDVEQVLLQRSLAHAEVQAKVRDALRELVDRCVTRFAESQRVDAGAERRNGEPYRGANVASNQFAGFDCGYALAIANARVARLEASLRNVDDLDVRLYAVPFLIIANEDTHAVVMRREDGTYVHEATS
jgi:hypothetical protein